MKLQLWFDIVDTEEQARAIVAREKAAHPRRKKHVPCYTIWQATAAAPVQYIVWYYI